MWPKFVCFSVIKKHRAASARVSYPPSWNATVGLLSIHRLCDFVTCDFVTLRRLNMGGRKRGYCILYIINNYYILFIYSYIVGRGARIAEVLNVTKSHVTVSTLWALGWRENGALAAENGALAAENGALADGNGAYSPLARTLWKRIWIIKKIK